MMAPIKTIYDTAVELALLSVDTDGMDPEELAVAVYRKASKFSSVLGDPDVIECIRYAESAKQRRVRIKTVSEDGTCIFVTAPESSDEEEIVEAELDETVEAALGEEPKEEGESTNAEAEAEEPESEGEGENPEGEDGKPKVPVVPATPAKPEKVTEDLEKLEVACDGILGTDVADVLLKCEGKVCDVYIGGTKHYSLMDLYCNSLAGKVVKIEIVGE